MKAEKKKKRGLLTAAVLLLAAGCVLWDSKYSLQSTEYELEFASLPREFDGLRIVQLSDLHGSEFGTDNERLAELVRRQRPDIIAITGDMAESLPELQIFEHLLEKLQGIAPIYYVRGNHEWAGKCAAQATELVESYGGESLDNEYLMLERQGEAIVLAGVDDPNGRKDMSSPEEFVERIRQEQVDKFTLLLGHRNYWVEKYPGLDVQLILCGHAHGGIVRLPFVGGLLSTKHTWGVEYEKGLYYGENYVMAVSRGLGNSIFVPRFLNRPELVTVILRSGQS